jgi:hypothetical protein
VDDGRHGVKTRHNGCVRSPSTGYRVRKPTPEPHVARLQARVAKGQTLAEAADSLGIPFWLAKAVFVRSGLPLPKPPRRRTAKPARPGAAPRPGQSREAFEQQQRLHIALALRIFAHELAAQSGVRGPVRVTMKHWDERRDPRYLPDAEGVVRRFGTWAAACEAAGVPAHRGRPRS